MINFHPHTKKEVCGICAKQILIGHPTIVCNSCDDICHKKCSKSKANKFVPFRDHSYCQKCANTKDILKYNPFFSLIQCEQNDRFYENEPPEYIENLQELSNLLETCKSNSNKECHDLKLNINEKYTETGKIKFTTYFENVDGNQSNFDEFSARLNSFNHDFSIIGLAETNIDKLNNDLLPL